MILTSRATGAAAAHRHVPRERQPRRHPHERRRRRRRLCATRGRLEAAQSRRRPERPPTAGQLRKRGVARGAAPASGCVGGCMLHGVKEGSLRTDHAALAPDVKAILTPPCIFR